MPRPNKGPRLILKQPDGYANEIYFIRWYERGAKCERSTGTSDIAGAEEALETHLGKKRRKDGGPRHPSEYPVSTALKLYASDKAASNADQGERGGFAIEALLGFWTNKNVGAINESTCVGAEDGYVKWRTAQPVRNIKNPLKQRLVSVDTARRELITLRSAINYAFEAGELQYAPFVHVPPKSEGKGAWMTPEFAAELVRSCRRKHATYPGGAGDFTKLYLPFYVLTMLYTGTRPGATLKLQWQPNTVAGDVDLARGVLYRAPRGRAKATKKRQTPVPIPPRLLLLLRYLRRRTRQHVFEINGKPIKSLRRSFATAAREALKRFPEMDGMKITPHTARHSSATWMLQRGVEMWEAAGYLGMTRETLEETYGHHSPTFMARATNAFAKHHNRSGNLPATSVKRRQTT